MGAHDDDAAIELTIGRPSARASRVGAPRLISAGEESAELGASALGSAALGAGDKPFGLARRFAAGASVLSQLLLLARLPDAAPWPAGRRHATS